MFLLKVHGPHRRAGRKRKSSECKTKAKTKMKFLVSAFSNALLLALLSLADCTIATSKSISPSEQSGRTKFFSFRPVGNDVAVGLDFELPFMQVPMKHYKDKHGNYPALVNINTASLITGGLLAGGGTIVGHLIRSLNLFQGHSKEDEDENEEAKGGSEERENKTFIGKSKETEGREKRSEDYLYDAKHIFDHFKLVYKNQTGERVETTLPNLFAHIEENFLDNEIDIGACVQKSICLMLQKSSKNVHQGKSTNWQKIVDGISSFAWLMDVLVPYEELRRAIKAGKLKTSTSCALAYPTCQWSNPETQLVDLFGTYVNFV